jgi:hypothetical protein
VIQQSGVEGVHLLMLLKIIVTFKTEHVKSREVFLIAVVVALGGASLSLVGRGVVLAGFFVDL